MSNRVQPRRPAVGSFDRQAARERVPRPVARLVFWTPIVGTAVLVPLWALAVTRPVFYRLLQEDYPVEWLQFALCLASSAVAALAAGRLARRREYLLVAALTAVAIGTFVLAGEEISWGQRVFALGTPHELAAVNEQAELNAHNIEAAGLPVQDVFKFFSFLLGLVGATLAWEVHRRGRFPNARRLQIAAPPLYTIPGFALMAAYWPALLFPMSISPLSRYQEWAEASLYVSLLASVTCVFLRSSRGGPALAARAERSRRARHRAATQPQQILTGVIVLVAVVTVVFAALTVYHGIRPGNVSG